MTNMVGWHVILRSAILWAVCWPLLVVIFWHVSAGLTGYARVGPGLQGLLGMWLVFAPGAAVVGTLGGCLLLWASRRARGQAALRIYGLAWGAGLGLLVGLLGVMLLVALVPAQDTRWSWGELVWALIMVPVERPGVLVDYAAVALSGAILGWIVVGWAAQVREHWSP